MHIKLHPDGLFASVRLRGQQLPDVNRKLREKSHVAREYSGICGTINVHFEARRDPRLDTDANGKLIYGFAVPAFVVMRGTVRCSECLPCPHCNSISAFKHHAEQRSGCCHGPGEEYCESSLSWSEIASIAAQAQRNGPSMAPELAQQVQQLGISPDEIAHALAGKLSESVDDVLSGRAIQPKSYFLVAAWLI